MVITCALPRAELRCPLSFVLYLLATDAWARALAAKLRATHAGVARLCADDFCVTLKRTMDIQRIEPEFAALESFWGLEVHPQNANSSRWARRNRLRNCALSRATWTNWVAHGVKCLWCVRPRIWASAWVQKLLNNFWKMATAKYKERVQMICDRGVTAAALPRLYNTYVSSVLQFVGSHLSFPSYLRALERGPDQSRVPPPWKCPPEARTRGTGVKLGWPPLVTAETRAAITKRRKPGKHRDTLRYLNGLLNRAEEHRPLAAFSGRASKWGNGPGTVRGRAAARDGRGHRQFARCSPERGSEKNPAGPFA